MLLENDNKQASDLVTVLTSNIDDMSPEILAQVFDKIMQEGALDACLVPIQMKKSRAASQIQVICQVSDTNKFADIILRETTSFGLRIREEKRLILERRVETIESPWGELNIKLGIHKGKVIKASAEFEDMKAIALQQEIALIDVHRKCEALCQNYLDSL